MAEENLRACAASRQCSTIELVCRDALDFFPPEPTVLYLFNSLREAGMRELVANLEHSLEVAPRRVWIVYHNPLLEHVLAESKFRKACGTHQYVINGNEP